MCNGLVGIMILGKEVSSYLYIDKRSVGFQKMQQDAGSVKLTEE